jgi:predicted O-methyltransferase YrrM
VKILERLLMQRPRLLNVLHAARMVEATSQTVESELRALSQRSQCAARALEIGSYQGVSSGRIAAGLAGGGMLYCIDPWQPTAQGSRNPCWRIFERHIRRLGMEGRVTVIRGFSNEVAPRIPGGLDFAFVDGDHSWEGLKTDWSIICDKLRRGGLVCLHDVAIPASEPWRHRPSVDFFENVIRRDPRFEILEVVHSMAVLRRCE